MSAGVWRLSGPLASTRSTGPVEEVAARQRRTDDRVQGTDGAF